MLQQILSHTFSITKHNQPKKFLTISQMLHSDPYCNITNYALGESTNISEEIYPFTNIYIVLSGHITITQKTHRISLQQYDFIMIDANTPYCIDSNSDSIFTEINIKENKTMTLNQQTEIFQLKNVLPYEAGKIVNLDLLNNEHIKIVLMSFDKDCGLPEHSAPGEALLFCLEGTGEIMNDGVTHTIHENENFVFHKGIPHSVKALTQFKMAIVLVKE